nr:MAG TPA: hypothetical protein [Caudoviricetes sp.]
MIFLPLSGRIKTIQRETQTIERGNYYERKN